MKLKKELVAELQNRLKVGNRRGVHLNAVPGRSRSKFDIANLSSIGPHIPADFINRLLSEKNLSWNLRIPEENHLTDIRQEKISKLAKSFENLVYQTETIKSEKGVESFGFGYPILARRDRLDRKITVAPILVWNLRVRRSAHSRNHWIIERNEEDAIYVNEILINHLYADQDCTIPRLPPEFLENGLITGGELFDVCSRMLSVLNENSARLDDEYTRGLQRVEPIGTKKEFENKLALENTSSLINFSGLFSVFEAQKQSIIADYDELQNSDEITLSDSSTEETDFQTISSIETDPSQQNILNSIDEDANVLIQGPPGTGKSQSLTAILVNALENNNKTLVVCEKRTALEVIQQSLASRGFGSNVALIKDIVRDRRTVVDSVRERIDRSGYVRKSFDYNKETLSGLHEKVNTSIRKINRAHAKLAEKLLGNRTWSDIVGEFLAESKKLDDNFDLRFDPNSFAFDSAEFAELSAKSAQGERLFTKYKKYRTNSFLNPGKLIGDNQYLVEDEIRNSLSVYREKLNGNGSKIRKLLNDHENNPDFFDFVTTERFVYRLKSLFSKSKRKTLSDQNILNQLCQNLKNRIEKDGWINCDISTQNSESMIKAIEKILVSGSNYFSGPVDIFSAEFCWFNFYNRLSKNERLLIDSLKEKVDWARCFSSYYLDCLLRRSATGLPASDDLGRDIEELGNTIQSLSAAQKEYVCDYWRAQQMYAARSFAKNHNGQFRIENLFNKRSSKRHRRRSLREIVSLDVDLFTTFFPVILTTPDVCSTLFKGNNHYFDLVIFDEASQLRTEDCIPALIKGKQVVVAGDEHQMPPSNYFNKVFEGVLEDEEELESDDFPTDATNEILGSESLLELADQLGFEKQYLDFHYRSTHPSLIDFSNAAFYKNRLVPLPKKSDTAPIEFINVGGKFVGHQNEKEAAYIVNLLQDISKANAENVPSIGIATFNLSQRNLILHQINEMRHCDDHFDRQMSKLDEKGLFVKNLENIQGDERDIIILSTTYGPNEEGKFFQRFGPLNFKRGYKLLNVIVTRAKRLMYVCTSVPEAKYLGFNEELTTHGSYHGRTVFYAYLAYAKAVGNSDETRRLEILNSLFDSKKTTLQEEFSETNSGGLFKQEVYNFLTDEIGKKGFNTRVAIGGYQVDLLYDTQTIQKPIVIECDGASFHLSKEAYLYDIHRQKIMEDYGYIFHRIWSLDWWRDRKKETKKLIEFIKQYDPERNWR